MAILVYALCLLTPYLIDKRVFIKHYVLERVVLSEIKQETPVLDEVSRSFIARAACFFRTLNF